MKTQTQWPTPTGEPALKHRALEQVMALELWARDYATTDYTDEMANCAAATIRRQHALIVQMREALCSIESIENKRDGGDLIGEARLIAWPALTAANDYLKG